jgi:dUTPase
MDSRSGTSKKTLDLLCRTVDAPYRGNIRVAFINHNPHPVTISNRDELFQIVILEKVKGEMKRFETEEAFLDYAGQTARGSDGFNSKERKQQGGKN